ncbi:acyltransferase family protein [Aquariibacter albus]|uniref:Acyltransferase n=1 Tax=Aquariibacter albus TaxID=2759899 RepID=A0A839HP91_9BURK|nr:acyltransferase family protein [Aquariibacter albus]MBB1161408.1 acyltransferase [Aquariibacter albus]
MDYRREIDGLRALAVLPVILFHAGFEAFSGGFVGVDVFFVISGYLITTIILAELEQGKFSIINFYERRARRILPTLFLVMLVCIPFAWLLLVLSDMKDFSQSLVGVSFFASNILFYLESGYFDAKAELKPLLHTWSLAVEEQYYVLFPLFLMLFWRLGRRWVLVTLGLVFVASLALAQWAAYARPAEAFYLLPARSWELLVGAFAAFYLSKARCKDFGRAVSELGGWLGVALILYAVFAYNKKTPFPGLYALVPTLGAVLIILFATQQTAVGKFVGNKVFVGVGLISYSAYLWHQPLFAFARQASLTEPTHNVFLALSILALVLAYFSWRYVETLFRDKSIISRKHIFLSSLSFGSFFVAIGLVGHFYNDKITNLRFNDDQARVVSSVSASPVRASCEFIQVNDSLFREPCRYFSNRSKVAVFGNSHATELAYSIASILKDRNVGIIHHAMSGCYSNYKIAEESGTVCGRWHRKVVDNLVLDKQIEYVVLSYRNEGQWSNAVYRNALASMANDLSDAGKKVVLVLQAPLPLAHINKYLTKNAADLSGSIISRKLSDWNNIYPESGGRF